VHQGGEIALSVGGFKDERFAAKPGIVILPRDIAPGNPIESAILITLDPGAYTAIVEGEGRAGLGIVEVYKVGQ